MKQMKRQSDSTVTQQKLYKGRSEQSHPQSTIQGKTRYNPLWQSLAMHSGLLQAKLTIGQADDQYEREADRVADQVMRMPAPQSDGHGLSITPVTSCQAQRECAECEEDEGEGALQRKERGKAAAPPIVHQTLSSPGRPIDAATRAFFEPRFGRDFSEVRVHDDARAVESARAVNALAFTVGQDIVFGTARYAPRTNGGRKLLAHELTHVIQQRASRQTIAALPEPAATPLRHVLLRAPEPDKAGADVPAPAQSPPLEPPGEIPVGDLCQNAKDVSACETHQKYLKNLLSPAVANIGRVQMLYSEALHALYSAGLREAQLSSLVPESGGMIIYPKVAIEVTVGSMKKQVMFTLGLMQDPSTRLNGRALREGVILNELSDDARGQKLAGIEETMVHEGMHVLSDLVTEANVGASPSIPANAPNLDKASYASQRQAIEKAVLPVIQAIHLQDKRPRLNTPEQDAKITADLFLGEAITRVESAIYTKQRSNQTFTKDDILRLLEFWLFADYWLPESNISAKVINIFHDWLDSDVRPKIISVQEAYLSFRP